MRKVNALRRDGCFPLSCCIIPSWSHFTRLLKPRQSGQWTTMWLQNRHLDHLTYFLGSKIDSKKNRFADAVENEECLDSLQIHCSRPRVLLQMPLLRRCWAWMLHGQRENVPGFWMWYCRWRNYSIADEGCEPPLEFRSLLARAEESISDWCVETKFEMWIWGKEQCQKDSKGIKRPGLFLQERLACHTGEVSIS